MRKFFTFIFLFYLNQAFLQTTQTFTVSGTFTVPTGVTSIFVECWGSGGSGGGARGNNSPSVRAMGGGGGGGAYVSGNVSVMPNDIISYTVAPQTAASTTTPVNGTASTFLTISAPGGSGGEAVTATSSNVGGVGGAGASGTTNGGNGGSGVGYTGTTTNTQPGGGGSGGTMTSGGNGLDWQTSANVATGGAAGSADGGSGANGAASSGNNGLIGTAPGGGGSGAYGAASTTQRNGGPGARGQIRITYTVLPIEVKHFSVKNNGSKCTLNLTTASETNNDFFTIERSADGSTFEAIGTIKGAGNSSREITYEFTDEAPLKGVNYYRIKQTDFDGKYSYSEVRSVRFTDASTITVSPRTTEGRINVTTDMEDYEVSVLTASGVRVRTLSGLSADQSISIEDLQPGIYFIRVSSGTHSETVRVIKI